MRFAFIATAAAAAIAGPFALSITGPQMSADQFLSAVRCTAYEDALAGGAGLGEAKWQLNAEARRQTAETAALAQAEISSIAQRAARAGAAGLVHEHAAACADDQMARGADSQERV
jgi:hypothetical protein